MASKRGKKKQADQAPVAPDQKGVDGTDALIVKLSERIAFLENELLSTRDDLQTKQEELEVQAEELETHLEELHVTNDELEKEIRVRQQSEEALRKSRFILAKSQEMAHVGNWAWHVSTGEMNWSDESFRIFGHLPQEFRPGWEWLVSRVYAGDRGLLSDMATAVTRDGKKRDADVRVILPDGAVRYVNLLADKVVRDKAGAVSRVYGIFQDVTERRRADEAIRENEQRLKRSQGIAHLGSWELDLLTNRLSWSDEVYRIFGLQPQEFGATYEAFLAGVHPDDRAAVDAAYSGSIRDGKDTYEIEHRIIRRPNGEVRFVHEKCEHFRDESGRIVRSVGMVHDITERKRLEDALKEREKQLKSRLNAILSPGDVSEKTISEILDIPSLQELAASFYAVTGVGISIIDLKGEVLIGAGWQDICTNFHRCNPETCKNCVESDLHLSGSVEEGKFVMYKCKNGMWDAVTPIVVNGRHIANLFSGQFFFDDELPDYDFFRRQAEIYGFDHEEYMAALDRAPRHSREKVRKVLEFYTMFGRMVSRLSYSNVQLAQSLIKQKESEQALQEKMEEIEVQAEEIEVQNEELRSNLEELAEKTRSLRESEERFSALADNIPNLAWMANADGGIFWYNRQWYDYTGTTLKEMQGWGWQKVHHPDYVRSVTEEWQAKIRAGLPYDNIFPLRGKDGNYRWFLTRVTPIRDRNGKIHRWFGTNTDITVRKRIEEELNEAKSQAELYLDLMGHDISNMHQIALSQLELAQEIMEDEGKLAGEDGEMIATPIETLRRSARLIENVGKLQKLRAGEYRMEIVDLGGMLAEVVEEHVARGKGATINCTLAGRCLVKANPLLKEAFTNLVGNAVKHSQGRPVINIDASQVSEGGSAFHRIAVEDNGPGIPDEKKGEIFHRFKRGQTQAKGTGLGLYIARTLVENFKGRILVEDRVPGDYARGSKFIVYLPVAED